MAECSLARCQQERRAIRKELQRWTKNMVYILGLERVAEELMGRRKWKLYQDALIPRRSEDQPSSEEESMPATDHAPALKIKTIEQINSPEDEAKPEKRPETILERLIKTPATQPKLELPEEPADWKPADKCYFCVDGEKDNAGEGQAGGGATSPASESDSSSVSGAKSPPAAPPQLLQHLLQMQLQAQSPQAIAQFQQMLAALAALGTGLLPPAMSQAWLMSRLVQRPQDRTSESEKPVPSSSPVPTEQPLDLSAKSTCSTSGTPPPDQTNENSRLKRAAEGGRRAYSEEELQRALREVSAGRLGTRRAAAAFGVPRSTLRNKLAKLGLPADAPDSDPDSDERDSPAPTILKIPTFPPPEDGPAAAAPVTPVTPHPPPPLASPFLMSSALFADPPAAPQHIFTSSINDVIAKSISQKFHQQPHEALPYGIRAAPDRHVSVIKTPPDARFPAAGNSRQPSNNGQPAGGKGTRPKRGKYRNYDRDSLVEAVKAVQRGEMSVHRAGSYYGVPHSTLEYKVKERHLMRPRKREPKPQPPDAGKPPPPKPAPPKPAGKPFANGLNGPEPAYGGASYPFWSGGFAPPAADMYASHMMRRLREEAPPANGSFLEGIIRSSLDRPLLARLEEPPARRARLDGAELAADMRDALQRLRADKLRRSPPAPAPPAPAPAPPAPAPPAPPDRA